MNRFVRSASPRQLLGAVLGIIAVVAAGSTLAVAASGGGPVPPAKPLAQAVHDALAAPPVNGIAADVTFKNSLIDASELQGSDPLLAGGTGRVWLSDDHQFRLELQTDGGAQDAQIVVDRGRWWAYDPSSNTVYEGTVPAGSDKRAGARERAGVHERAGSHHHAVPTVAKIQQELQRVMKHLGVSTAIPSDVAGQPAYSVRVTPKDSGGLIGGAEVAWDAARGVPLRVALYARGDSSPVLELSATNISYGPQPESVFSISPPSGAKVVKVDTGRSATASERKPARHRRHGRHAEITGPAAVAKQLPFSLDAPSGLAGLSRQSVRLLRMSGHPAALVVYGHGLGSVMVLEQLAGRASAARQSSGEDRQGLSLPTVAVNGATAQELDTAIGTVLRFTRSGVSYTVAGSVPRTVADAAARGL